MTERLVVVGAGGFGRETLDVIEAVNAASLDTAYDLIGVVDDQPSQDNIGRLAARGVRHIGTVDAWLDRADGAFFLVAIGSPLIRIDVVSRLEAAGRRAATLVHPDAGIGSVSAIGAGTIVCAGVQISTNVRLGRHVHVNPNATIGHDATLGDFASINPAATISGACSIAAASLIGAASVILQGLATGHRSVIGAGACVVRDVPPGATVKGVPAR